MSARQKRTIAHTTLSQAARSQAARALHVEIQRII